MHSNMSSFPNKGLSEEEHKVLFYVRTVFKAGSIQLSELEYAFKLLAPTIISIANGHFERFDSPDLSTPQLLRDETDSLVQISQMSTPVAQASERARTGPTPSVQIFVEDKKGEEKVEVELENEDSTANSVTDTTPSPHDLDDDNEFEFREPIFLFDTPPP
jgi:hypothetical protein